MIKTEVILVTGDNLGYISNTFERLEVSSRIYPTHHETLDRYFSLNGVKYLNVFPKSHPLLESCCLGNVTFYMSPHKILMGMPLNLTSMQSKYFDKILSFLISNIEKISVLSIYDDDGFKYEEILSVDEESILELINSKKNDSKNIDKPKQLVYNLSNSDDKEK